MADDRPRDLLYVCGHRLPTEKAHGWQTCKMCEAFARHGQRVTLLHPYRHQRDPELRGADVFDYYGLDRSFAIETLPNLDAVRLERFLPSGAFRALYAAHGVLWGVLAARSAARRRADLHYARDPAIAYGLVRRGLPTVYEVHAVPGRVRRALLRRIARAGSLRSTVALTSFTRRRLLDLGFPADRTVVLPDAVDPAPFDELPDGDECRRRLDLPTDRPIVGYVGRFEAMGLEKGIDALVRAMARVPAVDGRAPLLLAVGGPMSRVPAYRETARAAGLSADRLRFVDRVPNREVPSWIRACDVVTIPWPRTEFSAYFTSPLKLFEYMAAGVPVVASDLPSLREILADGENARLVEPGDPAALARGIGELLTDRELAGRLARRASREVRRHTWERRAAAVLDAASA